MWKRLVPCNLSKNSYKDDRMPQPPQHTSATVFVMEFHPRSKTAASRLPLQSPTEGMRAGHGSHSVTQAGVPWGFHAIQAAGPQDCVTQAV